MSFIGHVKTFKDLMSSNITISHKARHGYITASLHDAYLTILNRFDWWDDKTYLKFFFNEDNSPKKNLNLITRETRLTLFEIDNNVKKVTRLFSEHISHLKQNRKLRNRILIRLKILQRTKHQNVKAIRLTILTNF